MKIDPEEARRIARLACLEFDESEIPLLSDQLSEILTYMERLNRLETSRVEPTFHTLANAGPFREDVPAPPTSGTDGADPGSEPPGAGPFIVPRVIG